MAKRQDIRLAITPKGESYYQKLVDKGYLKVNIEQRTEWDILQDLIYGGSSMGYDGIKLADFLAERQGTILGRKLQFFAARGERGQIAAESYGRTLHRLIKEGYVKSWIH